MAFGETIPALKEALVDVNLGRSNLQKWMFVAEITDEFILGMGVLRGNDAWVILGRHLL
jgi:hypothetical protein